MSEADAHYDWSPRQLDTSSSTAQPGLLSCSATAPEARRLASDAAASSACTRESRASLHAPRATPYSAGAWHADFRYPTWRRRRFVWFKTCSGARPDCGRQSQEQPAAGSTQSHATAEAPARQAPTTQRGRRRPAQQRTPPKPGPEHSRRYQHSWRSCSSGCPSLPVLTSRPPPRPYGVRPASAPAEDFARAA